MSQSINKLRAEIRNLQDEIKHKNDEIELAHMKIYYWMERAGQAENELKLLKGRTENA